MFGDLLKSVGKVLGVGAPEAPLFEVPASMPAVPVASAAELAKAAELPAIGVEAPPSLKDPSALMDHLLNERKDMVAATKALSAGLPPEKGAQWAADSATMVAPALPPEEQAAARAAAAAAASPSAASVAAARKAAEAAPAGGPGSLAAQAAGMIPVAGLAAVPGAAKLGPTVVAGAVIRAVAVSAAVAAGKPAMPEAPKLPQAPMAPEVPKPPAPGVVPPQVQVAKPVVVPPDSPGAARTAQAFKTFLDRGLSIAGGG